MHKCHKPNHLWICSLYSNISSHIHTKLNIALDTFIQFSSHKSYKYFYLHCTILYCFTYLEKDLLTTFKNMVIPVHLLTWTIWPLYLFIYFLTFSFKNQKTVEIVAEGGNMSVLSCLTWTDRRKGADARSPGPPPLGNPVAGILRQRALDLKVLPKASGPSTCEPDIPESLAANGALAQRLRIVFRGLVLVKRGSMWQHRRCCGFPSAGAAFRSLPGLCNLSPSVIL